MGGNQCVPGIVTKDEGDDKVEVMAFLPSVPGAEPSFHDHFRGSVFPLDATGSTEPSYHAPDDCPWDL